MHEGYSVPSFPDRKMEREQPKWRQDFPIDVESDEYNARRDFTKFLVLTSFAFVCGQLWIGLQSLFRTRRSGEERIAAIGDLEVGKAMSFHYPTDDDPCLLIRRSESEFLAYSSECTHLMCPVIPELDHNRLHCPCHRGIFSVDTGQPTAGPPRRPLTRIKLRIGVDAIYATEVERRTA